MRQALAHYDNTGTAVADITVGEDACGVWFSGKLRDGITDRQIHELLAASLSGDWRGVWVQGKESMEMCAALAVNVPGFPVPRTTFAVEGGRQLSLVAAGIPNKPVDVDDTPDPAFVEELFASLRSLEADHVFSAIETLKGK
jgi:hypothetical protein